MDNTEEIKNEPLAAAAENKIPVMPVGKNSGLGKNLYKNIAIAASVIASLLLIAVIVLFFQNRSLSRLVKSSAQVSPIDANKALLEAVGKLIILPSNEQPTIATVADLDKLKGQPFFAQAQVGDKVLIYQNAKKAILYRPSSNKIIELAPLNVGEVPAATSTSATSTEPVIKTKK